MIASDQNIFWTTINLMLRRSRSDRLEAWATRTVLVATLRDAALRATPQGEVVGDSTKGNSAQTPYQTMRKPTVPARLCPRSDSSTLPLANSDVWLPTAYLTPRSKRAALLAARAPSTEKVLPGSTVKPAVTPRSGRNSCTQAARNQPFSGRALTMVSPSSCAPRKVGSEVVPCAW